MRWRLSGGQRKAQAFATAEDRRTQAEVLAAKRAAYGQAAADFDPIQWVRFKEASAAAGGRDLLLVVEEWKHLLAAHAATPGITTLSVAAAVTDYLAARSRDNLAADSFSHLDLHLRERFAGALGSRPIHSVDAKDIQAFLDRLPFSPVTTRHHLISLTTFFAYAHQAGWVPRNPCAIIKPPKIPQKDVTVLPLDQAQALFAANVGQPVIARLALEAFGGLRYKSAARLQPTHLDFKARGIAMPGQQHKSEKRKYREGQPPNLWAWLRAAPRETWALTPRQILEEKSRAFIRAGIDDKAPNVLRHSFASYHVAAFRNPPLTAYLMQHSRTTTTEIYLGVARRSDALRYFAIRPPATR